MNAVDRLDYPALDDAAIRVAATTHREPVLSVLVDAFRRDPVVRWMFPGDDVYDTVFPSLVAALGGAAFEHATASLAGDRAGAALWLPPAAEPDGAAIEGLVTGALAAEARTTAFAIFEQMGRAHPAEPHWYLPFVGVIPEWQGRGLGGALLAAGLSRCDEDGLPVYLESTNPRNVPLYRRHGFEVSGEIRAGDCPPLIPMIRPPRR